MKIFDIISPRRMAWVALGAAIIYLIVAFAVGGEAIFLVILVPPLLLLGVLLWLRWLPAAWAGAVLGLGMVAWFIVTLVINWSGYSSDPFSEFGIGPDLLMGGPIALIGLAAFMSELPHLHLPRLHRHGPKPAH